MTARAAEEEGCAGGGGGAETEAAAEEEETEEEVFTPSSTNTPRAHPGLENSCGRHCAQVLQSGIGEEVEEVEEVGAGAEAEALSASASLFAAASASTFPPSPPFFPLHLVTTTSASSVLHRGHLRSP
jgi:hypothetical protein